VEVVIVKINKFDHKIMKSKYLPLVLFLMFISCKKEKETLRSTATITVTPVYSKNHFNISQSTYYYKGDTIRYDVIVSSEESITELIITMNGTVIKESNSFSDSKNVTERIEFIISNDPGEKLLFEFLVKETTGVKTITKTNIMVSALKEKVNLKVVNKSCLTRSSDSIFWYFRYNYFEPEIVNYYNELDRNSYYVALLYQSQYGFSPQNTSNTFYKRINATYSTNGARMRFMKVNETYGYFSEPNQIATYFKTHPELLINNLISNYSTYIDPVAEDEVYLMEYDLLSTPGIETYFILKITDIVDDGLTSTTGGNDNDYIKLDIKYFNPNRF